MHLKKRRCRRRLVVLAVALLIGAVLLIRLRYYPTIRTLVQMQIDNEASNLIVDAINEQIDSGSIRYDRIITLQTDESGRVCALQTDLGEINRLKADILRTIGKDMREMSVEQLSVPIGNVLAPSLLSGVGGYVPVRLIALRSSGADFVSEFTQTGINQTMHQISLNVRIHAVVLTPAGELDVPVHVEMVVAQTVIVGEVPQTVISITGE